MRAAATEKEGGKQQNVNETHQISSVVINNLLVEWKPRNIDFTCRLKDTGWYV